MTEREASNFCEGDDHKGRQGACRAAGPQPAQCGTPDATSVPPPALPVPEALEPLQVEEGAAPSCGQERDVITQAELAVCCKDGEGTGLFEQMDIQTDLIERLRAGATVELGRLNAYVEQRKPRGVSWKRLAEEIGRRRVRELRRKIRQKTRCSLIIYEVDPRFRGIVGYAPTLTRDVGVYILGKNGGHFKM